MLQIIPYFSKFVCHESSHLRKFLKIQILVVEGFKLSACLIMHDVIWVAQTIQHVIWLVEGFRYSTNLSQFRFSLAICYIKNLP
jgi:hypothetical protein